jgi:hypothetical protein
VVSEDADAPRMVEEELHNLDTVRAAVDQISNADENVSIFVVLSRREHPEQHLELAMDIADDEEPPTGR